MKLLDADCTSLVASYERAKAPKDTTFSIYLHVKSV